MAAAVATETAKVRTIRAAAVIAPLGRVTTRTKTSTTPDYCRQPRARCRRCCPSLSRPPVCLVLQLPGGVWDGSSELAGAVGREGQAPYLLLPPAAAISTDYRLGELDFTPHRR